MITQIKFVSVNVRDQDKALAFYRAKLGFEVRSDQPMDPNDASGDRWIEVAPPGAQMKIVLYRTDDESKIGESRCVLTSDNIQKTYVELTGRGVEFTKEPNLEPWGWWAEFKDVDGNWFGLAQSA